MTTAAGTCGSTSAPRPGSARPTRCWARGTDGSNAAPTWSSASSRPTAGRTPPRCSADSRSVPRKVVDYRGAELHRDGPGRACWPGGPRSRWSTNSPTPTCRAAREREALAGHRRAAGRRDRRDLDGQHPAPRVDQRRGREDHRRTAAGDGARTGWSARADQIELVDMTPEALRRRMAHGNVYAADKIDAALGNYFRVGNLSALRELALLWLADRVDAGLQQYRQQHDIVATWEARERVVVALTGGPEGETLIRRAARIAARSTAATCSPSTSSRSDGLTGADPGGLAQQRQLVERPRRHLSPGRRRRHAGRPAVVRPGGERDPAGARRQPAVAARQPGQRAGDRRKHDPRLRRHRRAHRHARADRSGSRTAPSAGCV